MTAAKRKRALAYYSDGSVPEGARKTVARKLRLTAPEDTDLVAVASLMGLDLSRAVGALARAELRRRRRCEHEIDDAGVDTGAPVT